MNHARRYLRITVLLIAVLAIAGYSAFAIRGLVEGPRIYLLSPVHGETITEPIAMVEGETRRISFLYLNGQQIYTDTQGHFREPIVLSTGYNVITVEAVGRFERKTKETIAVIAR